MTIPLNFYTNLPHNILDISAHEIDQVFPHPSIVELEGRREDPLFLSILLHGNELSSFYVLQKLALYLKHSVLPRSLIIFIGNVYATKENQRYLHHQHDYNRIWKPGSSIEHVLASEVLSYLSTKKLFAAIDIHNNTGANPHYGCINNLSDQSIYLASLFSKTLVYFKNPATALSVALSHFCPATTIECGQSGEIHGIEKAYQFILDTLHLESLDHNLKSSEVNIFQTVGQIKILPDITFSFHPEQKTLTFPKNFEQLNFSTLETGFSFANYTGQFDPLIVINDNGENIFTDYFFIKNQEIYVKKNIIASMFTKNSEVIGQDCLGYIMEEVSQNKPSPS